MQPLHPRLCSPRSQRLQPSQRGSSSRGHLPQQTADRLLLQLRLLQPPIRCTTPRCTTLGTDTRPSRPLQASRGTYLCRLATLVSWCGLQTLLCCCLADTTAAQAAEGLMLGWQLSWLPFRHA